jgi:archaellum component FlaF (FlaF/FlaG flagellin family)
VSKGHTACCMYMMVCQVVISMNKAVSFILATSSATISVNRIVEFIMLLAPLICICCMYTTMVYLNSFVLFQYEDKTVNDNLHDISD